jgi:hypothetical protein
MTMPANVGEHELTSYSSKITPKGVQVRVGRGGLYGTGTSRISEQDAFDEAIKSLGSVEETHISFDPEAFDSVASLKEFGASIGVDLTGVQKRDEVEAALSAGVDALNEQAGEAPVVEEDGIITAPGLNPVEAAEAQGLAPDSPADEDVPPSD